MKWRITYDAHQLMDVNERGIEASGPIEALRKAGIQVHLIEEGVRYVGHHQRITVRPYELRHLVTFGALDMDVAVTVALNRGDADWLIDQLGGRPK